MLRLLSSGDSPFLQKPADPPAAGMAERLVLFRTHDNLNFKHRHLDTNIWIKKLTEFKVKKMCQLLKVT